MKTIVPDYYPAFTCIADKCKHSCCAGWEIDLDPESVKRYQNMDGEWGNKIRQHIQFINSTYSFKLTADERCPFLKSDGLCEMILELGEASLCQICSDHPRFRHEYSDRVELGLGLCCEAACELITTWPQPVKLMVLESDGLKHEQSAEEKKWLNWRSRIFQIVQDRRYTFARRVEMLCFFEKLNIQKLSDEQWIPFLMQLEHLDPLWTKRLQNWTLSSKTRNVELDSAFEQLLVYFLFRHLKPDGALSQRRIQTAFAVLCTQMIQSMLMPNHGLMELQKIARTFSAEIEYSLPNTHAILNQLSRMM